MINSSVSVITENLDFSQVFFVGNPPPSALGTAQTNWTITGVMSWPGILTFERVDVHWLSL